MRVVGSGGFGITYEAEDINLGTMVAIKEYYPFDFGDRDRTMSVRPKSDRHKQTFEWGRSNFLQEARTLARFEHPSIVRVTRVFEANSTAYMVMRFEQGQSFEEWLQGPGPAAHAGGARRHHRAAARCPADDARGQLPASRHRARQHHHPHRRHPRAARFRRRAPRRRRDEPLAHRHRQGRLLAARAIHLRRPPAGAVVGPLRVRRHALPRRHRQGARGSHAALRRGPHGPRGAGRQGQVSPRFPRCHRHLPQGQALGAAATVAQLRPMLLGAKSQPKGTERLIEPTYKLPSERAPSSAGTSALRQVARRWPAIAAAVAVVAGRLWRVRIPALERVRGARSGGLAAVDAEARERRRRQRRPPRQAALDAERLKKEKEEAEAASSRPRSRPKAPEGQGGGGRPSAPGRDRGGRSGARSWLTPRKPRPSARSSSGCRLEEEKRAWQRGGAPQGAGRGRGPPQGGGRRRGQAQGGAADRCLGG